MINLESYYYEGITNLQNWSNHYDSQGYSEKIAYDIFYRRYTIEFMWPTIVSLIEKGKTIDPFTATTNGTESLETVEKIYNRTATEKTSLILDSLLKNSPADSVGGIKYEHYANLIKRIQNGDREAKEDLEFSYLYYLLSDKAILIWVSLCATGFNKTQAIAFLSGISVMPQPVDDYETISSAMGQLCAAPYLNKHYTPLP